MILESPWRMSLQFLKLHLTLPSQCNALPLAIEYQAG